MPQLPDVISFNEWVRHVFGHPVSFPEWWFCELNPLNHEAWNPLARPHRTLDYLTRLFCAPAFLMNEFTRDQIDQGLNYMVSPSASSHMAVLTDLNLPWAVRKQCLLGIKSLYSELMAPAYGDELGHTQMVPLIEKRGNYSCYMWWDLIPLSGNMDHPDRGRITEIVMHVFETTLSLRSESCVESVLHGLGHWHAAAPVRTSEAINVLLSERPGMSDALRNYAEAALLGHVQ